MPEDAVLVPGEGCLLGTEFLDDGAVDLRNSVAECGCRHPEINHEVGGGLWKAFDLLVKLAHVWEPRAGLVTADKSVNTAKVEMICNLDVLGITELVASGDDSANADNLDVTGREGADNVSRADSNCHFFAEQFTAVNGQTVDFRFSGKPSLQGIEESAFFPEDDREFDIRKLLSDCLNFLRIFLLVLDGRRCIVPRDSLFGGSSEGRADRCLLLCVLDHRGDSIRNCTSGRTAISEDLLK